MRGREGKEGQTISSSQSPHMPTFEIPTAPSFPERGCLVSEPHARRRKCAVTKSPYGSMAYDREKGTMPLEWENEDEFLGWLAAEEHENTFQLIVSRTEASDSPNWQVQRVHRCSREFSGGKHKKKQEGTKPSNRKISTKKTGCRFRLTIKHYPDTETIRGKYEGQHDHALGDDNL